MQGTSRRAQDVRQPAPTARGYPSAPVGRLPVGGGTGGQGRPPGSSGRQLLEVRRPVSGRTSGAWHRAGSRSRSSGGTDRQRDCARAGATGEELFVAWASTGDRADLRADLQPVGDRRAGPVVQDGPHRALAAHAHPTDGLAERLLAQHLGVDARR